MNKINLIVHIGDCEFNEEFTLECADIDSANKLIALLEEKCDNVLFAEIKENKMNFEELQKLLNLLKDNSEDYTIKQIIINDDYADVYFNSSNYEALEFFELHWDYRCEMHNSNNSYVRFTLY